MDECGTPWIDSFFDAFFSVASIELQGSEVKSCRQGAVNLKDSYARIDGPEIFLVNAHISPYPFTPRTPSTPPAPANCCCAAGK